MSLIILYGVVGLLLLITVILNIKLKRIAKVLSSNNKALNETRELVATHHKQLKKLITDSK